MAIGVHQIPSRLDQTRLHIDPCCRAKIADRLINFIDKEVDRAVDLTNLLIQKPFGVVDQTVKVSDRQAGQFFEDDRGFDIATLQPTPHPLVKRFQFELFFGRNDTFEM